MSPTVAYLLGIITCFVFVFIWIVKFDKDNVYNNTIKNGWRGVFTAKSLEMSNEKPKLAKANSIRDFFKKRKNKKNDKNKGSN